MKYLLAAILVLTGCSWHDETNPYLEFTHVSSVRSGDWPWFANGEPEDESNLCGAGLRSYWANNFYSDFGLYVSCIGQNEPEGSDPWLHARFGYEWKD